MIDRLYIVTVSGEQVGELAQRLLRDGFTATEINSLGGLLTETQVTLLVGLEHERQDQFLAHVRDCCRRHTRFIPAHLEGAGSLFQPAVLEAEAGGALVLGLPVERFVQL
jgi:uncharacterized protein YaaQ